MGNKQSKTEAKVTGLMSESGKRHWTCPTQSLLSPARGQMFRSLSEQLTCVGVRESGGILVRVSKDVLPQQVTTKLQCLTGIDTCPSRVSCVSVMEGLHSCPQACGESLSGTWLVSKD